MTDHASTKECAALFGRNAVLDADGVLLQEGVELWNELLEKAECNVASHPVGDPSDWNLILSYRT